MVSRSTLLDGTGLPHQLLKRIEEKPVHGLMELRPLSSFIAKEQRDSRFLWLIEANGPHIGFFGQRSMFQAKNQSSALNELKLIVHSVSGVPQGECCYVETASS